jgi:ABC-type Fe3+/spermidine/putrescine transport system ATPase subunit
VSLKIEDLRVAAGSFSTLVESLEIRSGELCVLLGKSGSGKTTFLHGLSGFLPLQSGRIAISGKPVENLPPEKRRMALVFQRATLFPFLDVKDNIAFSLRWQKLATAERMKRVDMWLERLEITDLARRRPHQLSEGQAQRVALARALITGFPVLLLDEPFSSVDLSTRVQLRSVVKALVQESKVAALMVTHHPDDALAIADSLVIMEEGRIAWKGTPKDLPRELTAVQAVFGGQKTLGE